jgi:UDP-N-acetylglucosamine--N-acetylmuramyl-(pentapeptide) pyrophosphoryl-undecaprenol N-acetylglucosamine transferase
MTKKVLLVAGGTGGHVFPAIALAHALKISGSSEEVSCSLVTDKRASGYISHIPPDQCYQIIAATPNKSGLVQKGLAVLTLLRGLYQALRLLRALKPDVVVGFGGYPTVSPLLAAWLLKIPCIAHEQNAVIGRANRFLAPRMSYLATGCKNVRGISADVRRKTVYVGNPVREQVLQVADTPYPPYDNTSLLRILVMGGSQGARIMSDIVPVAVQMMPEHLRIRLHITQQARAEDVARVQETYALLGVSAEINPFFQDLPQRMANSHLVIARAGASTVTELMIMGRPSLLVPLPSALDQDQAANAQLLEEVGGAVKIMQPDFTPERLANELILRLSEPDRLFEAAFAAKTLAKPDAASALAQLVLSAK